MFYFSKEVYSFTQSIVCDPGPQNQWTTKQVTGVYSICSNRQKYIEYVKIIAFYFMPKIIRTLSKDHVPLRYFVIFLL